MTERTRTTTQEATLGRTAAGVVVPSQRRPIVVEGRLVPRRESVPFLAPVRWRPWVVAAAVGTPVIAVAGFVAGVQGARLIGQAVAAVGALMAVVLLVQAGLKVGHRRHCPGCPDH